MTKLEQWPFEAFDRFCEYANTPWAKLPLAHVKPMGLEEAAFLALLINHIASLRRYGSEYWRRDGWFYFTRKYAQRIFGFSAATQIRLIKKLKKAGYIEEKQFGIPPKRHIRVNIKYLEKLHTQWSHEFDETTNRRTKLTKQQTVGRNRRMGRNDESSDEIDEWDETTNRRTKSKIDQSAEDAGEIGEKGKPAC